MKKQKIILLLKRALSLRQNLNLSSYCLFSGKNDGLSGLIIHNYENHFFIQTQNAERDKDIDFEVIIDFLKKEFSVESIWLKNHCDIRKRKNLSLQDQLLYGKLVDTIKIQENGLNFLYSTKQTKLFPLQKRQIRKKIFKLAQLTLPKQKLLVVSQDVEFLFAENHSFQIQHLACKAPFWSEACENLRKLSQKFSQAFLSLSSVYKTQKNQKGLFHFFYNFLKCLDRPADLLLEILPDDKEFIFECFLKASQKLEIDAKGIADSSFYEDYPQTGFKKNKIISNIYEIKLLPKLKNS